MNHKENKREEQDSIDTDSEFQESLQYLQSGQLSKAEEIYKRILKINPNHSDSLHLLGVIAHKSRKNDIAVNLISKAIQCNPRNPVYYNNLGNALKDQGKLVEAISYYQKALELKPDFAEVYNNLGNAFKDQGKLDEAIFSYQKALEFKPNLAEAYYNLGIVFVYQGKPNAAISYFQKALELKPDYAKAYKELFHQFQQTCAWREIEDMTAKLDDFTIKAIGNGTKTTESPFVSLARNTDLSRDYAIAKSWGCDIARTVSTLKINFSFEGRRPRKAKIIVGYLSNDFRDHAMAHLTLGLYGLHNRDGFKIFCYSYGEDDGSLYSTRIRQDCDKFVDIRDLSHADAARCIYQDRVDILVDLKGYLKGSRLEIPALRPAPVQVRYLGLPCTTGADFIDYIITDKIAMPEGHARYYSEDFVYLPHCYQINDNTQEISNKEWKKSDFGLPEGSFVFCSFNQGYKIESVMFDVWMKILQQVPEGVLWLQRGSEIAEKNLRHEAESRGVKPTRLIFSKKLSKDRHLGRLRIADVALDTRLVNGIITTSDALWAGVPVITLQGNNFASRISSSILTAIGLPELVTQTLEEYEFLAVDMARNPGKLQQVRQEIARNRLVKPLFDTPRFTRNLENAYREMWEIFVAGESPRQIDVVES